MPDQNSAVREDIPNFRLAYSIEELREATGDLGRTKIYEEIRTGRLEAKKVGGRTIVTLEAARKWLAALPTLAHAESGDSSAALGTE